MKKMLVMAFTSAILLILVGCVGIEEQPLMPPERIGTEFTYSPIFERFYTFEDAYAASDMVAHIKIGDWLYESEEYWSSLFQAKVINVFSGEEVEEIVLVQDGTSKATYQNFPLFTHGNELLVFLKRSTWAEYENAYWILGSYTTMLDVLPSDSGDIFYMDRYGILGRSIEITENYALKNSLATELQKNAAEMDPMVTEMKYVYPYVFSSKDIETLLDSQAS